MLLLCTIVLENASMLSVFPDSRCIDCCRPLGIVVRLGDAVFPGVVCESILGHHGSAQEGCELRCGTLEVGKVVPGVCQLQHNTARDSSRDR